MWESVGGKCGKWCGKCACFLDLVQHARFQSNVVPAGEWCGGGVEVGSMEQGGREAFGPPNTGCLPAAHPSVAATLVWTPRGTARQPVHPAPRAVPQGKVWGVGRGRRICAVAPKSNPNCARTGFPAPENWAGRSITRRTFLAVSLMHRTTVLIADEACTMICVTYWRYPLCTQYKPFTCSTAHPPQTPAAPCQSC